MSAPPSPEAFNGPPGSGVSPEQVAIRLRQLLKQSGSKLNEDIYDWIDVSVIQAYIYILIKIPSLLV